MVLADEVEDLKKKLAESKKKAQEAKQRFLNAKAVAESFKSKLDTESRTTDNLWMTVS